MLKDINEYTIFDPKLARYVYILDRDPKFAASFIVKGQLQDYYNLLKEVFQEVLYKDRKHELLYDTISDSKDNYRWFVIFFKEIERILGIKDKFIFPLGKRIPQNSGEAPNALQPYSFSKQGDGKPLKLEYKSSNVKNRDFINNYRVAYILKGYQMHEFQGDSYPAWYLLKNTTIFEQYDERTNKRVRVDVRDGDLYYFIAGASDNWRIISDVPKEMDYVISALIYRHFNS
jgi:hypothetical protein